MLRSLDDDFPHKSMENDSILNTEFTFGWLESVLQFSLKTSAKFGEKGPLVEQIGVGKGYMSQSVRVFLNWQKNNSDLPTSVILKVPSIHLNLPNGQMESAVQSNDNDRLRMTYDFKSVIEMVCDYAINTL